MCRRTHLDCFATADWGKPKGRRGGELFLRFQSGVQALTQAAAVDPEDNNGKASPFTDHVSATVSGRSGDLSVARRQ